MGEYSTERDDFRERTYAITRYLAESYFQHRKRLMVLSALRVLVLLAVWALILFTLVQQGRIVTAAVVGIFLYAYATFDFLVTFRRAKRERRMLESLEAGERGWREYVP